MKMIFKDNTFVIMTEPKNIYFDLPKDTDNNLKRVTGFITKQ